MIKIHEEHDILTTTIYATMTLSNGKIADVGEVRMTRQPFPSAGQCHLACLDRRLVAVATNSIDEAREYSNACFMLGERVGEYVKAYGAVMPTKDYENNITAA